MGPSPDRYTGDVRDVRDRYFEPDTRNTGTRVCEIAGCYESTRHGKPFCSEHVEKAAYPAAIMARLARRENDLVDVERGKRLSLDSPVVVESKLRLAGGVEITFERLAKDTGISFKAAKTVAECLRRHGIGRIGRNARGRSTIRLVTKMASRAS